MTRGASGARRPSFRAPGAAEALALGRREPRAAAAAPISSNGSRTRAAQPGPPPPAAGSQRLWLGNYHAVHAASYPLPPLRPRVLPPPESGAGPPLPEPAGAAAPGRLPAEPAFTALP